MALEGSRVVDRPDPRISGLRHGRHRDHASRISAQISLAHQLDVVTDDMRWTMSL